MKAVDKFDYRRRLQISHLRHVVDSTGSEPSLCRSGAHDPTPGTGDRARQQPGSRHAATGPDAWPRTYVQRLLSKRISPRQKCVRCARSCGADLIGNSNWRGGDSHFSDLIEDRAQLSPAEAVISANMQERVAEVLRTLSSKIICMRFGIEDGSEHTLEEVGRALSVTRERIR